MSVVVSLLHSLRFLVRSRAALHALAGLARLALGRSHHQARDCCRLAPARLSPVLDVEKPTSCGPAEVPPRVCALIREMSSVNPLWGAPRIHGELEKLGISVSQSTSVLRWMTADVRELESIVGRTARTQARVASFEMECPVVRSTS